MIRSIVFNKTYSVEPWVTTNNPRAKVVKTKLKPTDRGYKNGKEYYYYTYIPLFPKGLRIEFKPNVNIIVGANGCGKSQLFKILHCEINGARNLYETKVTVDYDKIETMGFDFESDALKNIIKPDPESNETFLSDTMTKLDSESKSHGENTKILLDFYENRTKQVLFMDEPENGLDLPSQVKLVRKIKELGMHNQLFVITHNKMIIEAFDDVYDLDRKKWTTPEKLFFSYNLK